MQKESLKKIIINPIDSKKIVWFQNSNSYLVVEPLMATIFEKLSNNIDLQEISIWLKNEIDASDHFISNFIDNTVELFNEKNATELKPKLAKIQSKIKNYKFHSFFRINNYVFFIEYENENLVSQVFPTFAHLEVETSNKIDFHYQVYEDNDSIFLLNDGKFIGKWPQSESHIFQGKLSMQIIIDIYQKPEKEWMGVFHASAVSNQKEAMLFLGDSGNGKSTSLAILNAHGFDCIADDFVPIDHQKKVHFYPAAISIKKNSVSTLLSLYPELENSAEYNFNKLKKIVRFLPPKRINYELKPLCKALVFIKYNPEVKIELKKISKIDAFQQLVPDSWISPLNKNASIFMDWFLGLPCYQLTYSDNTEMIDCVTKLFNDEL
jgi:hypothetical protein